MTGVRLSVCVPVYNFAAWFGPTVESIARQARDGVEVLIVDGASTDETPAVAKSLVERFPCVQYHRLERRGGIDRDIARCVELARGEYCWVFGGDDLMREGTIDTMLSEISRGIDVYLVEATLCDLAMRPLAPLAMLDCTEGRTFRLHDSTERLDFFARARNSAALFSFCSAVVVRRSRWLETPVDDSFMGSCWGIAARIFAMIPAGLNVRYVPASLVYKRGDNDSFLTSGLVRRYGLSVDGYNAIADRYFGHDSREAFHVRRVLRAEMPWRNWLHAKQLMVLGGCREDAPEFNRLLRKQFSDSSLANHAAWLACRLIPGAAVPRLKRVLMAVRSVRARLSGQAPPSAPDGERAPHRPNP